MQIAMSSSLLQFALVACSILLLASARKLHTDREALIEAAIQEVKAESSHIQAGTTSRADQRLKAFKKASAKSLAHGMAAHKFERMVNVAERKILQSRRQATAQSSSMAEALAMELFHKPGTLLTQQELAKIFTESECAEVVEEPPNCDGPAVRKHRTSDGLCNNLEHPTMGAAGTPLRRLIEARYDDGCSLPRGYLQNQESPIVKLTTPFTPPDPSPRIVSLGIVEDEIINDTVHSHLLMQWGQFMDHDFDLIPEFEVCPDGCEVAPNEVGMCYPIPLALNDDDVEGTSAGDNPRLCHRFRRSLPVCVDTDDLPFTTPIIREHLNAITHFVDGSMVYHHVPHVTDELIRDPDSDIGLLRVGDPDPENSARFLLPNAVTQEEIETLAGCENLPSGFCFLAGDLRVNEQSSLTVMHTLWVREHNRIATAIAGFNPDYTSDKIFLTTREIVSAMIQKITYKDYLPILLGDSFSTLIPSYDLTGYNPEVDPSVPNAFASAAYRFGHSQIQPAFPRVDSGFEDLPEGPLDLNSAFFDTGPVRDFGIGGIARGWLSTPARKVDEFINSILTNNLFAEDSDTPGMDLASLNIQRGRDHGLPPYLIWKQWAKKECGLESDFVNELTHIRFLQTYGSLENVDLFVGGLAEEALPGGVVGAVFACIFTQTFLGARDGDRFYYENPDGAFTPAQIAEIEKATLSRVLCDNIDVDEVQPNAFLVDQDREPCSSIPSVDLSLWADSAAAESTCYAKVRNAGGFFGNLIAAVSQRDAGDTAVHFNVQVLSSFDSSCFSISCPGAGAQTEFAIFSYDGCPVSGHGPGLPDSQSIFRFSYLHELGPEYFVASNGFYATEGECESASTAAVRFNCNLPTSAKAKVQQEQDTDTDTDGLLDMTSGNQNASHAANEFVDYHNGGTSSNTQSLASKQEQLVNLMEDVLQALKGKDKETEKMEEANEKAKKESTEDAELVSELERLLQN